MFVTKGRARITPLMKKKTTAMVFGSAVVENKAQAE
jgi:hypothetical protein